MAIYTQVDKKKVKITVRKNKVYANGVDTRIDYQSVVSSSLAYHYHVGLEKTMKKHIREHIENRIKSNAGLMEKLNLDAVGRLFSTLR